MTSYRFILFSWTSCTSSKIVHWNFLAEVTSDAAGSYTFKLYTYMFICIQGVPEWSVQTLWISSRDLNKQKMSHKHAVGNACFWSYDGSKFSCNGWRNYHVKSHRCYKTVFIYFLGFATDITEQYICYSKCSKWPPLDSKEACVRRRIVWRTVHFHRHGHTPDGYPPVHQASVTAEKRNEQLQNMYANVRTFAFAVRSVFVRRCIPSLTIHCTVCPRSWT